jgi:hypothetical protein
MIRYIAITDEYYRHKNNGKPLVNNHASTLKAMEIWVKNTKYWSIKC